MINNPGPTSVGPSSNWSCLLCEFVGRQAHGTLEVHVGACCGLGFSYLAPSFNFSKASAFSCVSFAMSAVGSLMPSRKARAFSMR